MPPSANTATSVVPAPTSTTIDPVGSSIAIPAPIAQAVGWAMNSTSRAPARRTARSSARFCTRVAPMWVHTEDAGVPTGARPRRGAAPRRAPPRRVRGRRAGRCAPGSGPRRARRPRPEGEHLGTEADDPARVLVDRRDGRLVDEQRAAGVGDPGRARPEVEGELRCQSGPPRTAPHRRRGGATAGPPSRLWRPADDPFGSGTISLPPMSVTPGDFGDPLDEGPSSPLLPPDDRLWRHPSELGAAHSALPLDPVAVRRRWLLSHPTRRSALTAGVVGALLATGVVALGTHLADSMEGTGRAARDAAVGLKPTTAITRLPNATSARHWSPTSAGRARRWPPSRSRVARKEPASWGSSCAPTG